MEKISPHSLSMKNESSSVAPIGASAQSRTIAQTMTYMERLVIELSNPDLRENALRVLSKVLINLLLLFCLFLMSFIILAINLNLGIVVSSTKFNVLMSS
ncbi:hypothetical protein MtrunA17_Chr6g0477181 [Medicago truncatula]|uniref:Transmembrane protein n=1 Tax=Medicago truncatula TaxID=3880 RepID=A0A396HFM3_MEDTR|nr:hypothetical protein MtrunA17_Chr6g0477181 [Medicago truncatula]